MVKYFRMDTSFAPTLWLLPYTPAMVCTGQLVSYEVVDATAPSCPVELVKVPVPDNDRDFHRNNSSAAEPSSFPFLRSLYNSKTGHAPNRPRQPVSYSHTINRRYTVVVKTWKTYWEKDDFAVLDMFSVWTTSAYHSKHCTGRYQDTREDQVDQERTGGVQSTKTYERWGSPAGSRGGSSWQTRMASYSVAQCVQLDTGWIKVKVKSLSGSVSK